MKKSELLNIQANAQEKESNETYSNNRAEVEPMEGTPFTLVTKGGEAGQIEGTTFIAVGNMRVTEPMHKEQAKAMVHNMDWQLITSLIGVMCEKITEEKVQQMEKDYLRELGK